MMYYLPPLSFKHELFDIDLLCDRLSLDKNLLTKYEGLSEAIAAKTRHATNWSVGDAEDRKRHLIRVLSHIYHPDKYNQEPEWRDVFAEIFKHINQEGERIEAGEEAEDEYKPSNKFEERFGGKDTRQTKSVLKPITLTVTLAQLYNQDRIQVPETEDFLECSGDLSDGLHRKVGERQVIVKLQTEPNAVKKGLDYVVTVPTNPLQLLYYTHKVKLPNDQEVEIKTGDALEFEGLGFKGKEGVGDLIVEYKVAKMPALPQETRKKLHDINIELFYTKR